MTKLCLRNHGGDKKEMRYKKKKVSVGSMLMHLRWSDNMLLSRCCLHWEISAGAGVWSSAR